MSKIEINRISEPSERSLPIFAEFEQLADQIRVQAYELFKHRGAGSGNALDDWLAAERRVCCPAAELAEADGAYSLKVSLAGFDAKEITVTATPHEVLIKAAHEHEKSGGDDQARVRWSEFRSNNVFRRVALPDAVDVDKIAASLKNGLLELRAPKVVGSAGAEKPRKVKLSTPS